MKISEISGLAAKIRDNIKKVVVGGDETINLSMAALFAGGHVLLEDVPGTGKTVLAKSLSVSVGGDFKRIQFTPDLLPSDVTGTSVFNQKESAFEFRKGPAFTNILLADEINRATPRTQSALLECMEERQITNDGVTLKLDSPFFVIATQNPIEIQGTFPLPEAQLDRFLLRLGMGYPTREDAVAILDRFAADSPLDELSAVTGTAEVTEAQEAVKHVQVNRDIAGYIAALSEATRTYPDVSLGVSTRGMLAMMRASQALAAINGRDYVLPDDVKTLLQPVFSHRIIMRVNPIHRVERIRAMLMDIASKVPVPTETLNGDAEKGSDS